MMEVISFIYDLLYCHQPAGGDVGPEWELFWCNWFILPELDFKLQLSECVCNISLLPMLHRNIQCASN